MPRRAMRALLLVACAIRPSAPFMLDLGITYLGTGSSGGSGDGGHRLSAMVNNLGPSALSANGSTLYFTDGYSGALRAVNRSTDLVWRVRSLVGGSDALAVHPLNAFDVFVADKNGHVVRRYNGTPGAPHLIAGNGTGACVGDLIKGPVGLAANETTLFISDACNVVRALDLATGALSVFAGNGAATCGTALFNGANRLAACLGTVQGLAWERRSGTLYVAAMNRVVAVLRNSSVVLVAGSRTNVGGTTGDGGPATAALFSGIGRLALWRNESLAMTVGNAPTRVRAVNLTSGIVSTTFNAIDSNNFMGDGLPATVMGLKYGSSLAVDDATGDVFVSEGACPGACRMYVVGRNPAPSQSRTPSASATPTATLSSGASPSPSPAAPLPWSAPWLPSLRSKVTRASHRWCVLP